MTNREKIDFKGKNTKPVLVTGGTGFIGRSVVNRLLADQYRVRTFSLPGEHAPSHWNGSVETLFGDITNAEDVATACNGVGGIIHLAALLGAGDYQRHLEVTVGGTERILQGAKDNACRMVATSSIAVYGRWVRDRECAEFTGHGPWNGPYSFAKQQQETLIQQRAKEWNLETVVIRPANIYGAGSMPWVEVVLSAMRMEAPLLVNGGHGHAALTHVDNLADALVLALGHPCAVGETYNVCDENGITWCDYFCELARLADIAEPGEVDFQALEHLALQDEHPAAFITPKDYRYIALATLDLIGSDNRFPASKIRDDLGWRPHINHSAAMAEIRSGLKR